MERHDNCSSETGEQNFAAADRIRPKLRYPFHIRISVAPHNMASTLSITHYTSHEPLGIVSDEEYQRYKDKLLEEFQEEWPDAIVSIEDDEEPRTDVDGVSGQAERDVRDRIEDIVNEVIDAGDWRDEEEDPYEDEEELDDEEEEEDKF